MGHLYSEPKERTCNGGIPGFGPKWAEEAGDASVGREAFLKPAWEKLPPLGMFTGGSAFGTLAPAPSASPQKGTHPLSYVAFIGAHVARHPRLWC